MTIKEAIKDIKDNVKPFCGGISLDMAIEAKEPLDFGDESYLCPCCKRNNFYKGEYLDKQNYCDYCGQAIKWD